MYQRNFGVDTVACMPRILVGGWSVDGGSWWFPHVCRLGALCGVMLSRLSVECWLRLEVALRARAPAASPFLLVSALLGGACSMASPLACCQGCSGVVVDLEVLPYCVVVGCSGVEGFVPQGTGSGCGSVFLCQVVRGCVALQGAWWPALVGQLVHFRGRHGCPAARGPGREGRREGVRGLRATGVPAPV